MVNSRNCFFGKKSDLTKLKWRGFSMFETYNVQVYGLKLNTTTGLERRDRQIITLYSVEAVKKFIIHQSQILFDPTKIVAHLRITSGTDHTIDSLRQQTDFDIEPRYEPSMGHSLKPTMSPGSTAGLYIIYNENMTKTYLMMSSISRNASIFGCDSIPLLPIQHSRTVYKVRAVTLKDSHLGPVMFPVENPEYSQSKHLKLQLISSDHQLSNSKEDLQKLMAKAQAYCRSQSRYPGQYSIQKFYRNKPQGYYLDILMNKNGIMIKYIKDKNGDLYAPINNQIEGLFFSASLDTRYMKPLDFSYFGDTRLFIPAEELITMDTRMYFSDFYCHSQVHYVTVVLTKRGSPEDRFCEGRLLELEFEDNPFFIIQKEVSYHPSLQQQKTFKMVSVNKFNVEFLYTENVDIYR